MLLYIIRSLYNKYLENNSIDRKVRRGDVIGVPRMIYEHYGVYVGDDKVIEYTMAENRLKLEIRKTHIKHFLGGSTTFFILDCEFKKPLKSAPIIYRNKAKRKVFSPEETVRRAESRLGEAQYNLISNNCEHFAVWCKTGLSISYQVEEYLKYVNRIFCPADMFVGTE
ncbi:MAG: hypothetical protein CVU87_06255 [Firmicutes bacterium HGW-Firmicutes-12]|nr:MAG: hypothetical protein CVU87_06255 [Firmicutes bacterium HGW-Firmicutes-12]